ncbi:MAG: DUF4168 domain-containing protein [Polyangia bacterium]
MTNQDHESTATKISQLRRAGANRGWAFAVAGVFTLMVVGFGGCGPDDKQQQKEPSDPPGLPDPAERAPAPSEKKPAPKAQPAPPPPSAQDPLGKREGARPSSPEPPGGEKAGEVSQSEIETFAQIQLDISSLEREFAQKQQEGAKPTELQILFKQRAGQIVEESDLDTERYNEIATLAQSNPDLQRRIQSIIGKKMATQ